MAARFGTDRAAIYYYFASKEELFQEVFQATAKRVLAENLIEGTHIVNLETPEVRRYRADQVIETFSALLYDGLKRR
nr:TetR family transcriptional regulator [Saccharopolyspora spinosa]